MLTPRSIPGEFVLPRILRHAPSCYILVTKRAPDGRVLSSGENKKQVEEEEGIERDYKL